jgi:carotenoid 1,2-hydratase
MAVPRSDVSGKITIQDDRKRTSDVRSFRGTGYHDHNLDNRWLAKTVREWHWGRAHFSDSTAVFCRYAEIGDEDDPRTQLMLVRGGELCRMDAEIEEFERAKDKFGIRYPSRFTLVAEDGISLETRVLKVIDSSFYHLRFLSTMELNAHGHSHSTTGITEFIAPIALKHRWFNWLSQLRAGKTGKGRFFR